MTPDEEDRVKELTELCEQLEAENLRLAQEIQQAESQIKEYQKIFYGEERK